MPTPVPMSYTAAKILNRVAAEVGFDNEADPVGSPDFTFRQLTQLLNVAGDDLLLMFPWEQLQNTHQIVTTALDTGDYPLPDDFAYMINQTGWERAQNVPLFGPLSPQDWTYLLGRDLVNQTIYASFRLKQGQFSLFPQPPPENLDVNFEYIGKNWVQDGDDPLLFKSEIEKNNDVPLYNHQVISRYLKVKFYEAHSMDSTKAQDDFNQIYESLTGKNMSAPIINTGLRNRGIPYLDTWRNSPQTNYGF